MQWLALMVALAACADPRWQTRAGDDGSAPAVIPIPRPRFAYSEEERRGVPLLSVQRIHGEGVDAGVERLVPSQRGGRFHTLGRDGNVGIWDLASRREIGVLKGHPGHVIALAEHPDGIRVVTASHPVGASDSLHVFSLATQAPLGTPWSLGNGLRTTADGPLVSIQPKYLRFLSADELLVADDHRAATLTFPGFAVRRIVERFGRGFTVGNGGKMAATHREGEILLWSLPNLAPAGSVPAPADTQKIAFDPVKPRVYVLAGKRVVSAHDLESDRKLWSATSERDIWGLEAAADGPLLLEGGQTIRRLDALSGDLDAELVIERRCGVKGHASRILMVGSTLVAYGDDLYFWNQADTTPARARRVRGEVRAAVDPKAQRLAVVLDGVVQFVELRTGHVRNVHTSNGRPVEVDWAADRWVINEVDNLVAMRPAGTHPKTLLALPRLAGHTAVSPAKQRVAFAALGDNRVQLFDTRDGQELAAPRIPLGSLGTSCLAWSADGERLLVGTGGFGDPKSPSLRLWTLGESTPPREFFSMALEPARMTDPLTNQPVGDPITSGIADVFYSCAISPKAQRIAGAAGQSVRIFDGSSGERLASLDRTGITATALAYEADGALLVGYADGAIWRWDPAKRKVMARYGAHEGRVTEILVAQGEFFFSTGMDGTVRQWHRDAEHSIFAYAPQTRRRDERADDCDQLEGATTAVFDIMGRFDFSGPGALEGLHFRTGIDLTGDVRAIDMRQAIDVFYQPDLVGRALRGEPPSRSYDFRDGLRPPPSVELRVEPAGSRATAVVDVQPENGGYRGVGLYRNGRLLAQSDASKTRVSFGVELIPGENALQAVASSSDRLRGYSNVVTLTGPQAPPTERRLVIFGVGIEEYDGVGTDRQQIVTERTFGDLRFATDDARAFVDRVARLAPQNFDRVEKTVLPEARATREGILREVQRLGTSLDSNDRLVVFLAGHGVSVQRRHGRAARSQFIFAARDYGSVERLPRRGLTSDQLSDVLGRSGAGEIVLFIDACESSAAADALAGDMAGTFRAFGGSSGFQVVASASSAQRSFEARWLAHGVFTYALLEAMGCKSGARVGSVSDVAASVAERVSDLIGQTTEQSVIGLLDPRASEPFFECRAMPS